jgi:hypothetical protein
MIRPTICGPDSKLISEKNEWIIAWARDKFNE